MVYIGVVSYGMYMLNTLVLDCLKPIFNRLGPHHPLLQFPRCAEIRKFELLAIYSPLSPRRENWRGRHSKMIDSTPNLHVRMILNRGESDVQDL